ncbi:hypothetical protein COCSADRAFT_176804 [Bipolaris sorokiniana ND90Pr]|uniref:Transcription factor domain-containing protein n=1 Tax=Cochliobolus sativus (strain ND90Pr / ATCC 201652) TaxID=665912 RepID=M2S754_COCSN|nr:uncharacterized protein COCSADRAFT_176804 [Bipolaris sorokiniana ND90Pr]EMD58200.1 hypothetical protein COCSADRAFT_176804 [Bipolaris sorokiniana ND90Pr]
MSGPRPKLTRRRGACDECRLKKRNESLCEYNIHRSRRPMQEKSIQSRGEHISTPTQTYAVNGSMIPDSSYLDHSYGVGVGRDAEGSANALNTPFSEVCFSQLVSDSARSYLDLDFADETASGTSQAKNTEPDYQASGLQNQMSCNSSINNTTMLDWLELGYDENLRQHSTAQPCGLLGTEVDSGSAKCTLSLLSERMVADKAETKPFLNRRTCDLTVLFKNGYRGSRKQQAVWGKVEVLLSSNHQACISDLLRKIDSGGEHQSLDLTSLPVEKLVQRAFRELGGLNLFIKEQDVTHIQERFFDPEKLPIDVSDMSLLITSLAWGALLDPELQRCYFASMVVSLCLAEKTGSSNLPALILGSITTAASLSLHLELVLRRFCVSDEQAIQAERAMWVLYCIDKSYALRWQTFSLVGDGSLPTLDKPNNTLQSDILTASSLQLLWNRLKYSRICSRILQLRVGAEGESSEDRLDRAVVLSTALEEWYKSVETSQMMLSLDHSDITPVKLRISSQYYEARFQLTSISLPDPHTSFPVGSKERRKLLKPSIREIIMLSSTIPSEHLLQDYNCLFINTLALCFLALDVLSESGPDCERENQALLSIVVGFFARMSIALPQSAVFEEVSSLVEILAYR